MARHHLVDRRSLFQRSRLPGAVHDPVEGVGFEVLHETLQRLEGVFARIAPLDTSTWIGRTRWDLYRKWHARPKLINGACFLARRETFSTFYPKLKTMVKDQELTRILNSPSRRWVICQKAVAKTEEPKNLRELFHQLVRWAYGSQHLRSMRERGYRAGLAIILFFFAYLGILSAVVALVRLDGIAFMVSLGGPLFLVSSLTTTIP